MESIYKQDPDSAHIALGTNVGSEPEMLRRVRQAATLLRDVPGVTLTKCSSVYRSPAFGVTDQPDFLNAVVAVRTTLSPKDLLCVIQDIEKQLGRVERKRWGPREIDLDIVLFGGQTVEEEDLRIPHVGLLERSFVLVPLLDIEPEAALPDGRLVREVAAAELVSGAGLVRIEGVCI